MEIILASNNKKKIEEIRQLLPDAKVKTMADVGFTENIPEPYDSFRENAFRKANTIYKSYGISSFADDSGLCVEALGGAPGVLSARFSGEGANDQTNNDLLLKKLQGTVERAAYYIAVICFIHEGTAHYFEGRCDGKIALQSSGNGGFGYDPLFLPEGFDQSFGTLSASVKSAISHRAKALKQFRDFLTQNNLV